MKLFRNLLEIQSPIRLIILVSVTVFVVESLIMLPIYLSPHGNHFFFAFVDPLVLVLLLSPVLYFFMLRPLNHHTEKQNQVEAILRKWEYIFSNAQWGVAVLSDGDFNIELANPAFGKYFHTLPESILSQPFTALLSVECAHDFPVYAYKARTQKNITFETEIHQRGGDKLPCLANLTFVPPTGAQPGYWVINLQDIAQQKAHQHRIERQNLELSLFNRIVSASANQTNENKLLEKACLAFADTFHLIRATVGVSENGSCSASIIAEFCRPGAESVLGLKITLPDTPTFKQFTKNKMPLLSNDTLNDQRFTIFHELFSKFDALSVLILPLVVNGKVIGSVNLESDRTHHFTASDVSLAWNAVEHISQSLAHIRLLQHQQRISAALEQLSEAVIITDTAGTIQFTNAALPKVTGYSEDEVIGKTPEFLVSTESNAAVVYELLEKITAETSWKGNITYTRNDGSTVTAETTVAPVKNPDGIVENYVGILRDVTRETELQHQFLQAQKMEALGRLTGGVAHDFNNILTAINGFADLLRMQLEPGHAHRTMTENILASGQRAARLIRQLMVFSTDRVSTPQIFSINSVVKDTHTMLKRIIGENIAIKLNIAEDLWTIHANQTQIEQVLINLAVNARDAMPDGGSLTIETYNVHVNSDWAEKYIGIPPGNYVVLKVEDTGIGMDDDTISKIFEPFFTTKSQGRGTGLGLATVYGIINTHGGHIKVTSTPNVGTTFTVFLPRKSVPQEITLSEPQNLPEPQISGANILLVEDDIMLRLLAQKILEEFGHVVFPMETGDKALEFMRKTQDKIHLLLTDVIMPGISGVALSQSFQKSHPNIPVVFMSGYNADVFEQHRINSDTTYFLAKPFDVKTLLGIVQLALSGKFPKQEGSLP